MHEEQGVERRSPASWRRVRWPPSRQSWHSERDSTVNARRGSHLLAFLGLAAALSCYKKRAELTT
jgi:hypothetical protein